MKLLTALLAFYILLLPMLPCTDGNESNQNAVPVITAATHETGHQDNDEGCNPFCNCNCCGQVFTAFLPCKILFAKPIAQKRTYFYSNSHLSSSYAGTVWQPPKLS